MKRTVLIMAGLCFLTCSSTTTNDSAGSAGNQKVLGGKEYINWTRGYQHEASYLDGRGNLYTVTYALQDSVLALAADGGYAPDEIDRLLRKATIFSEKVPADTLKMIFDLIKPASAGKYTEPKNTLKFDAGSTIFFAFLYDSLSASFKRFNLTVEGDWRYDNTSESAQRLGQLLRAVIEGRGL